MPKLKTLIILTRIRYSYKIKPYLDQKKESVKYWTKRLSHMVNPFPVYWASDSRDCDHVRATSPHRSSNGYRYVKNLDALYEGAEGPTSHWRITKTEYKEFVSSWRDYNSEAYENGRPYNPTF